MIPKNASSVNGSAIDLDILKWEGHVVPSSYDPGFVILSFLVSYVGAWTTLELMQRRTSRRGFHNWSFLAGASVSMGGIAVWSMYFIGNCAIILADGQPDLHIVYSPGFTALSFFLPVAVLFIAFSTVGANARPTEKVNIIRVTLGGTLAGLGVCGMHYLGQAGIANYECMYTVSHVVGAAVIAVAASIGALITFFYFRTSWTSTWWKRAGCASILTLAVSGMHWLAAVGTYYRLKPGSDKNPKSLSRHDTVAVVIAFSIAGCLVLLLFMFIAQKHLLQAARRAQQVVLAVAVFDPEGRILVSPEGFLPTRKVTNAWLERNLNDVFNTSHEVFHWIFRTSRYWLGVKNLIPAMRSHVYRTGIKRRLSAWENSLLNDEGTPIENYDLIFQELFCIAAADLAYDLGQPIENIGMLYEEIVPTGQGLDDDKRSKKSGKSGKRGGISRNSSITDLEREALGGSSPGKGQLLFLTRRVDLLGTQSFEAAGYRFASIQDVLPILARSLQVKPTSLDRRFKLMIDYASEIDMLDPGVHMACFAIRASLAVGRHGFDVLARRDAGNQLPTMQVPEIDTLEDWQKDYLNRFDTFPAATCLKQWYKAAKPNNPSQREREFAKILLTTIEALKAEIEDPFFNDALLIAKPIAAPCRNPTPNSAPGVASLITFRIICPIHSRAPGKRLFFSPLNYFIMLQHSYLNSPDQVIFARKTYRAYKEILNLEHAHVVEGSLFPSFRHHNTMTMGMKNDVPMGQGVDMYGGPIASTASHTPRLSSIIRFWDRSSTSDLAVEDSADRIIHDTEETNLVRVSSQRSHSSNPGITVNQTFNVEVVNKDTLQSIHDPKKLSPHHNIPTVKFANRTGLSTKIAGSSDEVETEPKTYVDELFSFTILKKAAIGH